MYVKVKPLGFFFLVIKKRLEETKMSINRKHSMKRLHKGIQGIKKCHFTCTVIEKSQ